MQSPLVKIIEFVTRKPRYVPNIEWSSNCWTHNVFRVFELLFGRKYGIRPEAKLETFFDESGKYVIKHSFYTKEALIAHTESVVRGFLQNTFNKVYHNFDVVVLDILGWEVATATSTPLGDLGYRFAIAYDNKSTVQIVSGSTQTYSFTTSGSDRCLFGLGISVGDDITGLTYNAVSTTSLANIKNGSDNRLYTFYLANPASGANNAVWSQTVSGFFVTAVQSYTGVDQSTPVGTPVTGTKSTASSTFSASITTTTADSWIVAFIRENQGSTTFTAGANTVVRVDNVGNGLHSCDSGATVSVGVNTLTATYNLNVEEAWVIVELLVVAVPSSSNIKTVNGVTQANINTFNGISNANIASIDGVTNN